MDTHKYSMLMRYWPFSVGGLVGPLMAVALSRWMPFPLAAGAAMFLGFSAAVWMFRARSSSRMPQGVAPSIAAILVPSCAAGVVAAVLTFLFPWK